MLSREEIYESQRLTLQIAELGGETHDEVPYIPVNPNIGIDRSYDHRSKNNHPVTIKFVKRKSA